MIKKLIPVFLFVFGVTAFIGGGAYFYKRTYIDSSWIPIKNSTPQETFNTYLTAAYAHDERAIKQISATNLELKETNFFGAFSKCIETKPNEENIEEEGGTHNQLEREQRIGEEANKTAEDDSSGRYNLFEDETVPVAVSGLVSSLNALNVSPKQIKITNSQVFQDEAVLTFIITDRIGNRISSSEKKVLFKKLGNGWKIFYTLYRKSEFKDLNFAVQKPFCPPEPGDKNF